jgi:CheY-like chemotaxis protein
MEKLMKIADHPEVLEILEKLLELSAEKEEKVRQLESKVKLLESSRGRASSAAPKKKGFRRRDDDGDEGAAPHGILIVEHNDVMKVLLQGFLVAHRLEVVGNVKSAEKALKMLDTVRPIIVTVELDLPEMNGFELTKQIKEKFPDTKVILFSLEGGRETVRQAHMAGADEFFTKPINSKQLLKAIKDYLCFGERQTENDRFGNPVRKKPRLSG